MKSSYIHGFLGNGGQKSRNYDSETSYNLLDTYVQSQNEHCRCQRGPMVITNFLCIFFRQLFIILIF